MEILEVLAVLDYRNYLHTQKKTELTANELANYLRRKPFGQGKLSRHDIAEIMMANYLNVGNSVSHIVPKKSSSKPINPQTTKLLFLEDYIRLCARNKQTLNTRGLSRYFDRDLPVFYNNAYLKHDLLNSPTTLILKICVEFEKQIESCTRNLSKPLRLSEIAKKVQLSEIFVQLVHLLPFINPKTLIEDQIKGQAFWVGLYNILRLHAIIENSRKGEISDNLLLDENSKLYKRTFYCVAGMNITTKDIKYGLLGAQSSRKGKGRFFKFNLICGYPARNSEKWFKPLDYRNRLICSANEPNTLKNLASGVVYTPSSPYLTDKFAKNVDSKISNFFETPNLQMNLILYNSINVFNSPESAKKELPPNRSYLRNNY